MSTMMLTELPIILRDHDVRASYDRIYRRVINGDLPAERARNGRWMVKSEDLPEYVEKLKQKVKSDE